MRQIVRRRYASWVACAVLVSDRTHPNKSGAQWLRHPLRATHSSARRCAAIRRLPHSGSRIRDTIDVALTTDLQRREIVFTAEVDVARSVVHTRDTRHLTEHEEPVRWHSGREHLEPAAAGSHLKSDAVRAFKDESARGMR